jgi:predicted acylesterase/phospholipase RssA
MTTKNVLLLDGGGVRGIYTHTLLHQMTVSGMVPKRDISLVVGVSAGSLVGALVVTGILSSVDEHLLSRNLPDVFRQKNPAGPVLAPMFDGVGKRATLKRLFGHKTLGEVEIPFAVLTSTLNGHDKVFCSWKEEDRHVTLVDVLDASSAAPVFFPPVYIEQYRGWFIDGGVVENKPLITGFMLALELFSKDFSTVSMLSIGTVSTEELKIDESSVVDMGLLTWLSSGLINILTGQSSSMSIKLIERLLGKDRFMRVTNTKYFSLENAKPGTMDLLKNDALETWRSHGSDLLVFLGVCTALDEL